MNTTPQRADAGTITPAVHLEFIRNQTAVPDGAGLDEVEAYHRALFLHHHAGELERFEQQKRVHEDRLLHLESRLKTTHGRLADLEKLVPVTVDGEPDTRPTSPWNLWDGVMFVAALLGIALLMVFGVLNISFNLLESGLVTFVESPIRAYFWAALLPVGALAVKVGWDFLQSQRKREAYLWACLAAGIAGVLVWVAAYALIYPTMSKSTAEHIESLRVFDDGGGQPSGVTAAGAKWIDAVTVAAQAAAEIFLSAVLGMYMTTLYARHRPVRLAKNPLFTQLDEERRLLDESVARERAAMAEARGGQTRLENQLDALVAFARSMFRKESALRHDQGRQKHLLLDQISEQLRSQLQSVDGDPFAADRNHEPDAAGRRAGPAHAARGKVSIPLLIAALGLWGAGVAARADHADSNHPPASRCVIGVSPYLDSAVKNEVYQRIVALLLEDLPVNSSLWLYDAFHLRTVTQVNIPNLRAFRSARTRANQFKDAIHQLKKFLAESHERPAAPRLDLAHAVRLPQFLDFVGENLAGAGQSVVVIVLGSPLYLDPKEPGFSMVDGYFPSDGHLLASRDTSVYGLRDRAGVLTNLVAHFGYFGDPWVSELHREKIRRFWTLYLEAQGARLATFSGDPATVFDAVRHARGLAGAGEPRHVIDRAQTRVEMLRITRDTGVSDWITRDSPPNLASEPPSTATGPMKIGIRWKGAIDLDLYATPRPGAEALYFERTRIPEGYYFKDHRSSPEREYEFIEFESPVDLRQVEARVNFYEGHLAAGPSGEVRVEFAGRIYSGRFELAASHGNQGRTGRGHQAYWTTIDVPALLRLR